ncbi:hypothetical protein G7Y89_g12071 [Cudoniella acicularis]|uniref:Peptide hydrolase n=1 Tax=Cudoniella acicularis TaxID=354080 RepID=A0A8H4R9Q2_9HELO|nr:hypothetical protein G7Y89_g12071 [Cudoniella acicularis]
MKCSGPISFVPMAVTLFTAVVYLAIIIPLLVVHETVPAAPSNPTLYRGLNISEAWLDLDELTNGYHPFNSRRNDEVRHWLLRRIEAILDSNSVSWNTDNEAGGTQGRTSSKETTENEALRIPPAESIHEELRTRKASTAATIFSDTVANYTSTALTSIGVSGRRAGISTYFEGSNIIVYIRGSEDEEGEWWKSDAVSSARTHGKGGVMVNAHFDSVSTGYGATDDGVGVITALQLIKYFTTSGNTPKKGVVALFNNGEEDGLYGAKAFLSHPMAKFVHTFLNLEGAGAGGRATLFRSTDTEVTRAYGKARHPFGTVVSADGFALGFVRSETDYVVFRAEGFRGLDVAFWEPRARYHTDQDDSKHTSKASLWHMLSASVETMKYLTSDMSNTFLGPRGDNATGKVKNGSGSDGVWFDLFGQVFAVFGLRTLFAWSLTLLIASPLILLVVSYILIREDKFYFFTGSIKPAGHESEAVSLGGWRGAFRFPVAFVVAAALNVGAAFLLKKFNPLIIYSSQYAVWTMSLSLFFCVYWFIMAGCNFVRPSALHRGYVLFWMFLFGWALLVAATVFEDRYKISGGYMFVFYESAIFLATLIGLLELFALPTKSSVVEASHDEHEAREAFDAIPNPEAISAPTDGGNDTQHVSSDEDAEANETTPLVGGNGHRAAIGTTFARGYRRPLPDADGANDSREKKHHAFGEEQKWSAKLPNWTWLLQFLLLGPFILIIIGQVGLLLVTATGQTGTDGSSLLLPYLIVALFSILILLPLGPFIHRITHHIPTFLFLIFIGTLIYNLVAFPFSSNNRYKAYFQQTVDLDTGLNHVSLVGLEEYIRDIISYIPSASGQQINCTMRPDIRSGLSFCSYEGPEPKVIDDVPKGVPPSKKYESWLTYNVTRESGENKATFKISGKETKACIIRFDDPFTAFNVRGAADNNGKWANVPETGSDQIKLWHRDWDREWIVDVEWPVGEGKREGEEGRSGRVVCLWSDQNVPGTIPALDEVQRFAPQWTSIVKLMDGKEVWSTIDNTNDWGLGIEWQVKRLGSQHPSNNKKKKRKGQNTRAQPTTNLLPQPQPQPTTSLPTHTSEEIETMPTPDHTTQCHFTLHLYKDCSHKIWLKNPKITHVLPCFSTQHKARCSNLAKGIGATKEVWFEGVCPKCAADGDGGEKEKVEGETEAVQKRIFELQVLRARGMGLGLDVNMDFAALPRLPEAEGDEDEDFAKIVVDEVEGNGGNAAFFGELAKQVVNEVEDDDPAFFGEWEEISNPSTSTSSKPPIFKPTTQSENQPEAKLLKFSEDESVPQIEGFGCLFPV